MKIDIWSDITCPFCYIGKRKLEMAMAQFPHTGDVKIVWHSYRAHPDIQYEEGRDIHDFLIGKEGMTPDQAIQLNTQITTMARKFGLDYNFNDRVMVNTLDAHRLSKLAAVHGLQGEAVERLFAAHFTEGRNLEDHDTLLELGTETGLKEQDIKEMLSSDRFVQEVTDDQEAAEKLDIETIPFFAINRKFGISGPQPVEVFLQALQKVWLDEHPNKGPVDVKRKKVPERK